MGTDITKRAAREEAERRLSCLSGEEVGLKSRAISNFLFETDFYKECKTMFIYMSMGKEVETAGIIRRALNDNKRVALPVVISDKRTGVMGFVGIRELDGLKKNRMGISEPEPDKQNVIKADRGTLIITPGLAFTRGGCRVGRGGGYYDRYLDKSEYMSACALCFETQLFNSVPMEKHDIRVDYIITEKGVIEWKT